MFLFAFSTHTASTGSDLTALGEKKDAKSAAATPPTTASKAPKAVSRTAPSTQPGLDPSSLLHASGYINMYSVSSICTKAHMLLSFNSSYPRCSITLSSFLLTLTAVSHCLTWPSCCLMFASRCADVHVSLSIVFLYHFTARVNFPSHLAVSRPISRPPTAKHDYPPITNHSREILPFSF